MTAIGPPPEHIEAPLGRRYQRDSAFYVMVHGVSANGEACQCGNHATRPINEGPRAAFTWRASQLLRENDTTNSLINESLLFGNATVYRKDA